MVEKTSIKLIAIGLAVVPLCIGWSSNALYISLALWIGIALWIFTPHKPIHKQDLYYIIPLLMVVIFAAISLTNSTNSALDLPYLAYICVGFLLFLAVRDLGIEVTKYIALAALLVAISCIIEGVITQNSSPRGITPNANLAAGYMLIAIFFSRGYQKWFIPVIALGLLFTGYEAILMFVPILGLIALLQYRYSIKAMFLAHRNLIYTTLGILVIIVCIGLLTGTVESVYATNLQTSFDGRFEQYKYAVENIGLIGHGYDPGIPTTGMWIHNVPLLIAVEFGILAALAWIFAMGYAVIKGFYRYPILALGMLSMVGVCWKFCDLSPMFWALLGLSASAAILKREKLDEQRQYSNVD